MPEKKKVHNKYNNAQYNFLNRNENFADIVNYAIGHEVCSPDTLRECDSREVAMVIEEALSLDKDAAENLIKLSKELFRDLKKLGVMKTDGRLVYLCVENQSTMKDNMRERINLYNALSYMKSKVGGKRIPVITVLSGWSEKPYDDRMIAFDDYDIGEDSPLFEFLPHYRIPVVNMAEISDEDLEKMNADIRLAVLALRFANGNLDMKEKADALERMDRERKDASDEAMDLTICYTNIDADKEKVMENGFTTFWRETREEGRMEGILNNILAVQKKMNMSFDEAAAFLDVSDDLKTKIKESLLPA